MLSRARVQIPPSAPKNARLYGARFLFCRSGGVHPSPGVGLPQSVWRRRGCGRRSRPQRGDPRRGSPLYPLLRFISTRGVPRAAARGQGSAPGPRPLFCKKAGQKTFKRQSTSDPRPSPLGRVIQSVREADTLAAEWQLPREWERRVGPETSRGRHHPKSAFLWGSTPFLWARPKKWGGTGSTNVKSNKQQNGEFLKPTPGRTWTPPLQKFGAARHHPKLSAARRKAAERGRSFRSGRPMTYITTASSAAICAALRARADQKAPVL